MERRGLTWDEFLGVVEQLPRGQLWRFATVGDLPGTGDHLDAKKLSELVRANTTAGARGFAFTHKPMHHKHAREAISEAVRAGFVVNLSADDPLHADRLAALEIAPVVTVLPPEAPARSRTPAGRTILVCLNETHGLTCLQCKLCAVASRRSIVGFRAHGPLGALSADRARAAKG